MLNSKAHVASGFHSGTLWGTASLQNIELDVAGLANFSMTSAVRCESSRLGAWGHSRVGSWHDPEHL